MQKIIPILFLFLLFLTCYFIYYLTEDRVVDITAIGDSTIYNPYLKNNINYDFVNSDYDINDLINTIEYNKELKINNRSISIHQLLNETDILLISIGMNDIYYKLDNDPKEIYTYLNNLIDKYDHLLSLISKYDYKQVVILNYYSIYPEKTDLFTYTNYKLNKLAIKYHYTYLDIAKILSNNPYYYLKNNQFYLNNQGYYQIFNLIVENLKKS